MILNIKFQGIQSPFYPSDSETLAILCVSRATSAEALEVFYSQSTFRFLVQDNTCYHPIPKRCVNTIFNWPNRDTYAKIGNILITITPH